MARGRFGALAAVGAAALALPACERRAGSEEGVAAVVSLLDRLDRARIEPLPDLDERLRSGERRDFDFADPRSWRVFSAAGEPLAIEGKAPLALPGGAVLAALLSLPAGAAASLVEARAQEEGWRLRAFRLPAAVAPDLSSSAALASLLGRLATVELPTAPPRSDRRAIATAPFRPRPDGAGLLVLLEAPAGGGRLLSLGVRELPPAARRLLPSDRPHPAVRIVRAGDDFRESLVLAPPARASFDLAAASPSRLRFAAVCLGGERPARLRVEAGGEVVLDALLPPRGERFRPFEVRLAPSRDGAPAKVSFEVSGKEAAQALVAIAHPTLFRRRLAPPDDRRPDLLLLSLDTLRADHAPGAEGAESRTPFLHEFAHRALVFTRAAAPSTWTLPSHASLFTGLDALRHGVIRDASRLPAGAVPTLAARLRDAGYRTVGFCASGYVHADFGLATGFERYFCRELYRCERDDGGRWRWRLDPAWDEVRAVLEEDDPRPLFLFLHTYAAHDYRCEDEEAARFGVKLDAETDLRGRYPPSIFPTGERGRSATPRVRAAVRALYAGAVLGADRFARRAIEAFEERSGGRGYVFVTSDHGEELFERDRVGHNGEPFETLLHVPLLVAGPGVERGTADALVSGVDLFPTLLELAGAPPAGGVDGRSLVPLLRGEPMPPRPIFAGLEGFASARGERFKCVALLDGGRRILRASLYDLASDPLEREDVSDEHPKIARRLLDLLRKRLERPALAAQRTELSPERARELRALGYLGDG